MPHPIWRTMPRMMKKSEVEPLAEMARTARMAGETGFSRVAAWMTGWATVWAVGLLLAGGRRAEAQERFGPPPPVTYDNRFEVYGGLNLMNFQAGQNLPKRMNLGGGEIEGTFWLTHWLGLAAEYRGEAGTTPVFPNPYGISRPLVYMNMALFGAQYRGPKNQHAAIDFHGYGGLSRGVFDAGTAGNGVVPGTTAAANALDVGLYSNRTGPIFAVGGSLDVNISKNLAARLSPDMIFEHFGTETREFFAISGGIVYRIPVKKKKK